MVPAVSPASLAVTVAVKASPGIKVPVVGEKLTKLIVGRLASIAGVVAEDGEVVNAEFLFPAASDRTIYTGMVSLLVTLSSPATTMYLAV